jgi:NADH-quinone oxidoreductase subunit H
LIGDFKNKNFLEMQDFLNMLIASVIPLLFILVYAVVILWVEIKVASHVQDRLGYMYTGGFHGWAQPIADLLKLLMKEHITPVNSDKVLFTLAPVIVFASSYAAYAALPFTSTFIAANLNVGVFYIIAITSFVVIGILMAGWSSNNKYSMLGAMRSVAQIVSYEVPTALSILTVIVVAGTLNLQEICQMQKGGLFNWFIFKYPPFMFITFLIYFTASLAEVNRTPFDIPEAESELVAGYHTEYTGMKFAMFYLAEYANMFLVSGISAILFFGGWNSPFGDFMSGPAWGVLWFVLKGLFFVFLQIMLRWTLPRLRVDQLMYVSWKVLTPISFVNILIVGLWALLK